MLRSILFSIILCLSSSAAYALSCAFPSCGQYMIQSNLVFKGKAFATGETSSEMLAEYVRKNNLDINTARGLPNTYTDFKIVSLYKGIADKTVRIFYTTRGQTMIAGDAPVERYPNNVETVIYAQKRAGFYVVYRGMCNGCQGGLLPLETHKAKTDTLEDLIQQNPTEAEFYLQKIALYEQVKDFDAAIHTYQRLFRVKPDRQKDADVIAGYGKNLMFAGLYEDALNVLSRVKDKPGVVTNIQLALMSLGRIDELSGQKLEMAGQTLSGMVIKDGDFSNADFSGAQIEKVAFENVNLTGANFSNVKARIDITGSRLENTDFSGAKLSGTLNDNNFNNSKFVKAELDLGETRRNTFQNADFTDGKFHVLEGRGRRSDDVVVGNDFTNARFRNANVGGLGGSVITGADFTGASFYSGRSTASQNQGLDLSGQNFDGSNMSSSNFSGGTFKNANLANTKFNGSNLTSVDFSGADLSNADFMPSNYSGLTQLQGADFTGANLKDVNWEGALFNRETKFPEGFDVLAAGLEPADAASAPKTPIGILFYSKERLGKGRIHVCHGDYHAACMYGFIIQYAMHMNTGSYSRARINKFNEIAHSLLDAGEVELARLLLYRSYAELVDVAGRGTVSAAVKAMMEEAGIENNLATHGADKTRSRHVPGGSVRAEALAALQAGDKEKARAIMGAALDKSKSYPSAGVTMDFMLEYADLFSRLDGPLTATQIKALEPLIRETPYLHFERRDREAPPHKDYVARAQKLLAAHAEDSKCVRFMGCVDGSDRLFMKENLLLHNHISFSQIGTHSSCPAQALVPGGGYFLDGKMVRVGDVTPMSVPFDSFEVVVGSGEVTWVGQRAIEIDDVMRGGASVYEIDLCSE